MSWALQQRVLADRQWTLAGNGRGVQDRELIQKLFRRDQIGGAETFGEALVDRLEAGHGVGAAALMVQQPGEARGRAQLPSQHLLTRRIKRLPEEILRRFRGCRRALQQEKLALEAQQLGRDPDSFGLLDPKGERLGEPPGLAQAFRQIAQTSQEPKTRIGPDDLVGASR
jgi:hypothetical protein